MAATHAETKPGQRRRHCKALQSTIKASGWQSASPVTITAITAIKSGAYLSLGAAPDERHGAVVVRLFQAH